jgi:hypothetical protein
MSATDTKTPGAAKGALQSLIDDAAETVKLRGDLKAMRKRENYAERMNLLSKLAAANLPGYTRGELFVDREVKGTLVSTPSPIYAGAKLEELRGLVSGKLKTAATKPRNPFETNARVAKEAQTRAVSEQAVGSEVVQAISGRSSASQEQIANTLAALEASGAITGAL